MTKKTYATPFTSEYGGAITLTLGAAGTSNEGGSLMPPE
jgi:hypothetical protein